MIREVPRALATMGVIDIRHELGSVVRRPDSSEMGDLFTLMLEQNEVVEDGSGEGREAPPANRCQSVMR